MKARQRNPQDKRFKTTDAEMRKRKLNYSRVFHFAQLLGDAFQRMNHVPATGTASTSPFAEYINEMLRLLQTLGLEPFKEVVLNGNCHTLLSRLPQMVRVLAWFNREKVVRAVVAVVAHTNHYVQHRQDIWQLICENCKSMKDLHIENLNSMISRNRPKNRSASIADLQRAAALTAIAHDFVSNIGDQEHHSTSSATSRQPESVRQELMHTNERLTTTRAAAERWLTTHLQMLSAIPQPPQSEALGGLPSAEGERETTSVVLRYIDRYQVYLEKRTHVLRLSRMERYAFNHYKIELQAILLIHGVSMPRVRTSKIELAKACVDFLPTFEAWRAFVKKHSITPPSAEGFVQYFKDQHNARR